jgi:energy-coupling factor transport system substrate-specific component
VSASGARQQRNVSLADIGRGFDARLVAAAGVMIGVTYVMTRVVQISIGASGYLHFGDVAIYVAGFLFGPLVALIAGASGTALADVSSGYGAWAPGTFVIHGLQALVAGFIGFRGGWRRMLTAVNVGGLILVIGYFLYQLVMIPAGVVDGEEGKSAFAVALSAVGLNALQAIWGGAIAIPLVLAIRKAYPPIDRWGAGPSWVEEE